LKKIINFQSKKEFVRITWKDPTILFDLEGILVVSVFAPTLHPEAHQVFQQIKKEDVFKQIALWTCIDSLSAKEILEQHALLQYFDYVITSNNCPRRIVNGNWTKSSFGLPPSEHTKDLTVLPGEPEQKVLIENNRDYGFPKGRVVYLASFESREDDHSLIRGYRAARLLL
jgi:phosphoglycolate phosphatase-like HAD superfamily hydrolase